MKRIAALAIFVSIALIPAVVQGEGVYKGRIWRERGVAPQGVPAPAEEAHPSAQTNEKKIVSVPCHKRSVYVKTAHKPKKIKTNRADSCLKEIRRNSAVIRKLERERGAAEERERLTQEWFRNYREWYKKFGEWQAKPKSWF